MNEIDRLHIIDQVLKEFLNKNGVPAIGASIVHSDGEAIRHVVGVRRRDSTDKVLLTDRWHIGSCTKSITVTAIIESAQSRSPKVPSLGVVF